MTRDDDALGSDKDGHFLVLHRNGRYVRNQDGELVWRDDGRGYHLHGGAHPTMFKTMRMALKAVRDGYTYVKSDRAIARAGGKVVLFDVNYLPLVADDTGLFEHAGLADKLTESEFCERQMEIWAELTAKARAKEKPLVLRCGVEGCRLLPDHEGLHRFGNNIP